MSNKITAGAKMPEISLSTTSGGEINLGGTDDRWRLIVVYRGLHCPICKRYLASLHEMKDDFDKINTDIITVSGDNEEKAKAFAEEVGLTEFPVAYDLNEEQMREMGLYITEPLTRETDRKFPEPGLYVVTPGGDVQLVDIANAPFARPILSEILRGIGIIQERDYPIRGTA